MNPLTEKIRKVTVNDHQRKDNESIHHNYVNMVSNTALFQIFFPKNLHNIKVSE